MIPAPHRPLKENLISPLLRQLADELSPSFNGSIYDNYPLAAHTSYQIGGPADLAIFPTSIEDFLLAFTHSKALGLPITILGGGSNVLISDKGIRGIVVVTSAIKHLRLQGTQLIAGAGATSHSVALFACASFLRGAEFLFCLPGSIGGACYMNARAYGSEMSQIISRVQVIDQQGQLLDLQMHANDFSYKHSPFQATGAYIVEVELSLFPGDAQQIQKQMDWIESERRAKHEMDFPSCGCVFKNNYTIGQPAGKIIESCGLKGFSVGDAQVSPFHANFIINKGKSTAKEVWEVVTTVQRLVFEQTGYQLVTEVQRLGDWDE